MQLKCRNNQNEKDSLYKISLHLKSLECPRSHRRSHQISSKDKSEGDKPKKGRDETTAPEKQEMEADKELRDRKITDKFGARDMTPKSYHVRW